MAFTQNNSQGRNDRVRFDMLERIGVLSRKDNGWTREVNIVAWNDGPGKVDIREWDPDHKRMTKGVTLFEDEAERLTEVLARRYGLIYPGNGQDRSFSDDRAGGSAGGAAEQAAGQNDITGAAPAAEAASMHSMPDSFQTIPDASMADITNAAACVAESTAQMDAAAPAMA